MLYYSGAMNIETYKICEINNGYVSIMARPSKEWLEDDISYLANSNIKVLVSLLTPTEVHELGLSNEEKYCEKYGIQFISFPIEDRSFPQSEKIYFDMVRKVYSEVRIGNNLVIHCRAGIGRAGLTAAAVLVCHGMQVDDAFSLISKARRVSVPDTDEQRQWLLNNSNSLKRV